MKLRSIILVLSLLAFLSTITGGYLYYAAIKKATTEKAETQAAWSAEAIRNLFEHQTSSSLMAVKSLSGHKEIKQALLKPNPIALKDANQILDDFNAAFEADVSYLIDRNGNTIASSNRNDPDSFVGKNYSFRPYFQKAIQGTPSIYMALGVTSGKRGIYYGYAVYGDGQDSPAGVVVMKASADTIEKRMFHLRSHSPGTITLITGPHGVIFMSDDNKYLFELLGKITDEKIAAIVESKQFGDKPLKWSGFEEKGTTRMVDGSGAEYIIAKERLEFLPGWHVVHLYNMDELSKGIYVPFEGNLGSIILVLCVFIGLSVLILYEMAQSDITRRKAAEQALKESEERFRSISSSINDALLTIDDKGTITFLNDAAVKIFGHSKKEALGKELHPLLAPERYLDAIKIGFDKFRETGTGNAIGKTLEMSAIRKDGTEFPIELSLSSYYSNDHWHAVGTIRDISDRKSAEQERENLISKLQLALKDVRQLSGLLPICSHCKKIRDDKGYWSQIETYIQEHSDAEFSHGICRECAKKHYPDFDIYE